MLGYAFMLCLFMVCYISLCSVLISFSLIVTLNSLGTVEYEDFITDFYAVLKNST